MATGLTVERVRRDVEVVAHAGLDLDTFLEEAVESVARAVPWVSACLATHDPSTHLLTSARKYGHLRNVNSHDHEFGLIEYGTVEPTAFSELAEAFRNTVYEQSDSLEPAAKKYVSGKNHPSGLAPGAPIRRISSASVNGSPARATFGSAASSARSSA